AVELAPALKADRTLRANLSVWLADKRTFVEAATLLIGALDDASARKLVLARAEVEGDGAWRHLALDVAESLQFAAEINLRRLYELDLAEGSRCVHRQAAVAKLRALGDPKAIPALEVAK